MILSRRALGSLVLVVSVVVPFARARADADVIAAADLAAVPPRTPVATAPQSPRLPKIEWRDFFWADRYGRLHHSDVPFQNGRLLEGEDLYLTLHRPDLAEAHRKRQETKTGLGAAAGIFLGSAAISGAIAADEWRGDQAPAGPVIGMTIGLLLSGVFGVAGSVYSTAPVTDEELHHLVDVHDRTP